MGFRNTYAFISLHELIDIIHSCLAIINFNHKNEFCILEMDINSNSNETHANVVHGFYGNAWLKGI